MVPQAAGLSPAMKPEEAISSWVAGMQAAADEAGGKALACACDVITSRMFEDEDEVCAAVPRRMKRCLGGGGGGCILSSISEGEVR